MIGSSLNATLPEPGTDSPSVAAARIVDTLRRLVDAVEGRVPSAAIDVTADLDMQTHGLQNVGMVGFGNLADSNDGLPGYLFRYQNNLWFVHPDGAFPLTDGTSINAAGIGGIGGDYGSGAESVEYDAAEDEYVFLDAPGDYADLVARGVKYMGPSTGSVLVRTDPLVSTDGEWLLTNPTATTSQLVVQTAAGVTGTANSSSDAFEFVGPLTVGTLVRVGRKLTVYPTVSNLSTSGWTTHDATTTPAVPLGAVAPAAGAAQPLTICVPVHQGDTITGCQVVTAGGNGTDTFLFRLYYHNGTTLTALGTATNAVPSGTTVHTLTVTPQAMGAGGALFVMVQRATGSANGVRVHSATITYTGA